MSDLQRVEEIFLTAIETAEPVQRAEYLKKVCADDQNLRRQVDRLLVAHNRLGRFLESSTPSHGDTARAIQSEIDLSGSIVGGKFKLLRRIGEGGMGSVWVAEQTEPVRRFVAVKLIHASREGSQIFLSRFEAERQAVARMDHPYIAKFLDAGATDKGTPYFILELIEDGIHLNEFCDRERLSIGDRLRLMVQICQALQHAHQKGVIHRDLKPSNILVRRNNGQPVPKVIDFGLAKAASGEPLAPNLVSTAFGFFAGTPGYMAPEQAEWNPTDLDIRVDIYSIGVILYELLTGAAPIPFDDKEPAALEETLRAIREVEPVPPSRRLSGLRSASEIAANRQTSVDGLTRSLRGELDWISLKALAKNRDDRYESASAFARDIECYLNGEMISAAPPSAGYRLRKFLSRNRKSVAVAIAILLALTTAVIGSTLGLLEAKRQAARAVLAEARLVTERDNKEIARQAEAMERRKAEQAEADMLASLGASTDDAIEQLIGSKDQLGPSENAYLQKSLARWQAYADRQGNDQLSRSIRMEGLFRVASIWQRLGQRDAARTCLQAARKLAIDLTLEFPDRDDYRKFLGVLLNRLGILLHGQGQIESGRAELEQAREIFQSLVLRQPGQPDYLLNLAYSHNNLAKLHAQTGQREFAGAESEKACKLMQRLSKEFPDEPHYRRSLASTLHNLGLLLQELNRPAEAEGKLRSAFDEQKKLERQYPETPLYRQELARTHASLGNLLAGQGQTVSAREEFTKARELQITLATDFPSIPEYQQELARTHNNLGLLLTRLRQPEAAIKEYKAAIELKRKQLERNPAVPEFRQDLARTHNNVANLLASLRRLEAAQEDFEMARQLLKLLVDEYPEIPEYQQDLAGTHNNLGNLFSDLGRPAVARTELESARRMRSALVEQFPNVASYRTSLGGTCCNLGLLLRSEGQIEDSLPILNEAVAVLKSVVTPDSMTQVFLRNSHVHRAVTLDAMGQYVNAVKDWDQAIELCPPPEKNRVRASRAKSLVRSAQFDRAISELALLTESAKWTPGQWYDFATMYAMMSVTEAECFAIWADRAMILLGRAVQSGFQDAARIELDPDLDSLREREDFQRLLHQLKSKKASAKP